VVSVFWPPTLIAAPAGPPTIELELEESDDILDGVAVAAKSKILLSFLHDVVARLEVCSAYFIFSLVWLKRAKLFVRF
jgi:hypothetical protein